MLHHPPWQVTHLCLWARAQALPPSLAQEAAAHPDQTETITESEHLSKWKNHCSWKYLIFKKHATKIWAKWKIYSQIETGRVCCPLFLHVFFFFLQYFYTLLGAFATRGVCKFCKALSWARCLQFLFQCVCCIVVACVLHMSAFAQGFLSNCVGIRGLSYAVFLCNFPCFLHCSCTCIILAIKIVQILSPGTFVSLAAVPESCCCSLFHFLCPCFLAWCVHYLKKRDFEYKQKSLQDNPAQFTWLLW